MRALAATLVVLTSPIVVPAATGVHGISHDLVVRIDPDGHRLHVKDVFTVERPKMRFLLHAGLQPTAQRAQLKRVDGAPSAADFGVDPARFEPPSEVPVELWELTAPAAGARVELSYGGAIHHETKQQVEEARSFGETPGTIGPEGVFLAGSTVWVPWTGDDTFSFRLEVELPAGWEAVSQGRRTRHERGEAGTTVVWDSPEPQTEVYLVAGRFHESTRPGRVEAMTFLRERDDALAAKYLDATQRYVSMYESLIGPYPYAKFALVENFWETGYGMPSFTLLGPTVIRLPFILTSSYPHEILHTWWGNGVHVDVRRGNWSEGLTAYLADHLLQEQSGDASEYRQTTLQKYADYVSRERDFPLASFRARHSASTEAVGYGKALMFFHELRRELGDETFVAGLRAFWEGNRFRPASFDDLRTAFEKAAGRDLGGRFAQAIDRTGAPSLALRSVAARQDGDGWVVEGRIEQLQEGEPFTGRVPLAITLEGQPVALEAPVETTGRGTTFRVRVPARPLRADLDPAFDVFRRLDPAEVPPALTRALGAERVLAILPASAPEALRAAYRDTALEWARARRISIDVSSDAEVTALPSDRTVWIFGWENRWTRAVADGVAASGARIGAERLSWPDLSRERAGTAAAAVARHPARADLVLAWIAADRIEQMPGFVRKLPHYHKYSYVAFEGDEPTNVSKGRWSVADSPLTVSLADGPAPARGTLARRTPLADVPPEFSLDRLGTAVRALSASDMEGRAPGSAGHDRAAAWIEAALRGAGLTPVLDAWTAEAGAPARAVSLRNIVGRLAGAKPELARQVVVVAAHYDHLGTGWPDVRAGNEGRLHPGADDNASGVAVLLELARTFAGGPPPDRTILFAALDGEEAGRLGSKRLVETLQRDGIDVRAMVNLDSVGRLGTGKLLVLGTGTASEWIHIARGAGFVTGVTIESVAADPGGSDQVSFHEAGIPAVQLFTGPHADYHAPGDTADKVDVDGLAKVAAVAREFVGYLATRPEPLTRPGTGAAATASGGTQRKVSLGTVPDFAFAGPGVRLEGVTPASPAEAAGLREGDVIVSIAGVEIADLRALSAALRDRRPGDRVKVTYLRGGERREVEIELTAR